MAVQMIGAIKRYTGTAAEIGNFSLVGVPVGSTFFESDTGQLKILSAAGTLVNAPSESVTLSGSNVEVIDVVIAESETESAEVDVSKYKYFAILMPAAWTDATLTIKGSAVTGGTKQTIKNDVGQTFPTMTVAVDTLYAIDANALMLAALPYISLVSSVAQESARTIKLICKA